jgi:hypothetical protein
VRILRVYSWLPQPVRDSGERLIMMSAGPRKVMEIDGAVSLIQLLNFPSNSPEAPGAHPTDHNGFARPRQAGVHPQLPSVSLVMSMTKRADGEWSMSFTLHPCSGWRTVDRNTGGEP